MVMYYIGFGLFIAVVCYFLNKLQKAERRVEKAYRDGFSAACNMQEPNYDLMNPHNAGIIKDRIEIGISSGFNYQSTKLYSYGWHSAKDSIENIISSNYSAFESVGLQIRSLDELFSFYKAYNDNHIMQK